MQRRKFLVGLGSLAAGGAAAMGSGAFTNFSAGRKVTADVVTDENAFLGIEPVDERTTLTNGELSLNFGGGNPGGGLNPDARTGFFDLFRLTNQGQNNIAVAVGVNGDDVGQASPISGASTQYSGQLLADQAGIDNVGVFAEEGVNGDGLGANGSVKIGIDSGNRVWLNQDGDPGGSDSKQYLTPGESILVDMVIETNNNLSGGDVTLDPGIVIMAVERGSDRDAT
ncbi:hypothetical protein [Haloarchaeobius sp. DT45]|uniref:hypothetical protein n=1 Tax=Haloarchaeobius sp. DT45 TaxID=3446116 RepID=UPI003F6B84E3